MWYELLNELLKKLEQNCLRRSLGGYWGSFYDFSLQPAASPFYQRHADQYPYGCRRQSVFLRFAAFERLGGARRAGVRRLHARRPTKQLTEYRPYDAKGPGCYDEPLLGRRPNQLGGGHG
jgi:hypothetical protein